MHCFFSQFCYMDNEIPQPGKPVITFLNNTGAELAQMANQPAITNAHRGHITIASKPHTANASNLLFRCTMNCGGTALIGIRQQPKRPPPTILTKISCCGLQEKRYNVVKLLLCRSKVKPSENFFTQPTRNWLPNFKRKRQRA